MCMREFFSMWLWRQPYLISSTFFCLLFHGIFWLNLDDLLFRFFWKRLMSYNWFKNYWAFPEVFVSMGIRSPFSGWFSPPSFRILKSPRSPETWKWFMYEGLILIDFKLLGCVYLFFLPIIVLNGLWPSFFHYSMLPLCGIVGETYFENFDEG